jgi:cell division protein FtsI/penicillin-binding protein 2
MPKEVRDLLMAGLSKAVGGRVRPEVVRVYQEYPQAVADYKSVCDQMVGKTATAEIVESMDLSGVGPMVYNHIWFAGASFEKEEIGDAYGKPELVVVVFLRFGGYGKEVAPVAAQMVQKWREIQKRRGDL